VSSRFCSDHSLPDHIHCVVVVWLFNRAYKLVFYRNAIFISFIRSLTGAVVRVLEAPDSTTHLIITYTYPACSGNNHTLFVMDIMGLISTMRRQRASLSNLIPVMSEGVEEWNTVLLFHSLLGFTLARSLRSEWIQSARQSLFESESPTDGRISFISLRRIDSLLLIISMSCMPLILSSSWRIHPIVSFRAATSGIAEWLQISKTQGGRKVQIKYLVMHVWLICTNWVL
jgi:hypothetical protein